MQASELVKRASELFSKARELRELRYVLYLACIELAASAIILCSDDKRLRRMLCRISTKRRINRALAILRNSGAIDNETYVYFRKIFRALRCYRNAFVHPVCVERCPPLEEDRIEITIERFLDVSKSYVERSLSCR